MQHIGNEKSMSYTTTKLKIILQHCVYINGYEFENLDKTNVMDTIIF